MRKKLTKTQRLANFQCNKSFEVFKHWCSLISKRKKKIFFIFYTCIPEKVSAIHTGSAFTQHYYVCRVLFILKLLWLLPSLYGFIDTENWDLVYQTISESTWNRKIKKSDVKEIYLIYIFTIEKQNVPRSKNITNPRILCFFDWKRNFFSISIY